MDLAGRQIRTLLAWSLLAILCLAGCGSSGSDGSEEEGGGSVRGAITGTDGSQGGLSGWYLVLVERNTGVSRVSMVNQGGLYEFRGVRMGAAQTMVLLSPAFKLTAVLAIKPKVPQTIRQFFMPQATLPQLIHNGKIMTFFDESKLEVTGDMAADSDEDLIPEGLDPVAALNLSGIDQDQDGVDNEKDPDIDGDGLINWFDDDDDADGILDIFDQDVDGNFILDQTERNVGDCFFTDCIEWFATQLFMDSSTSENSMKFATKLRSDCSSKDIRIRGAASLFSAAQKRRLNTLTDEQTGEQVDAEVSGVWDLTLVDDGLGGDGNAKDRVWGEVVYLQPGSLPAAGSVIFLQVGFGSKSSPWYKEYPFIFPDIKMKTFSVQYDATIRRVTMVGDPFDTTRDYVWKVEVVDADGQVLWISEPTQGTASRSLVIGKTDVNFIPGEVYKIRASAQSLDRIPSRPAYVVKSSAFTYTAR